MGVIIMILVVIAALLAVVSGVWVALALITAINLKQKRIIDTGYFEKIRQFVVSTNVKIHLFYMLDEQKLQTLDLIHF